MARCRQPGLINMAVKGLTGIVLPSSSIWPAPSEDEVNFSELFVVVDFGVFLYVYEVHCGGGVVGVDEGPA